MLQGRNASQALANSTANTTAAPASTANSTATVSSLSIRNETTNTTLPLDQLNSTLSSSAQNTSLLLAAGSGTAGALTALSSGGEPCTHRPHLPRPILPDHGATACTQPPTAQNHRT